MEDSKSRQTRRRLDESAAICSSAWRERAGLHGLAQVFALPGQAGADVAVAVMDDRSKLMLNLRQAGRVRVAGTLGGSIGAFDVAGRWAIRPWPYCPGKTGLGETAGTAMTTTGRFDDSPAAMRDLPCFSATLSDRMLTASISTTSLTASRVSAAAMSLPS